MKDTFEKQNDNNQFLEETNMGVENPPLNGPAQIDAQQESAEMMAEEVYENDFKKPLAEMMNAELSTKEGGKFVLSDIVNEQLNKFQTPEFSALPPEEQTKQQKQFCQTFIDKISSLPGDAWSISPKQTLRTGAMNCSNAASVFGMTMKNTQAISGIRRIDYVSPYGHAMNIVQLLDGSLWYADPRNGVFENITDNVEVEEQNNLNIYRIKKPTDKTSFHILPGIKYLRDAVVRAYAGNVAESNNTAKGEFDEVLEIFPEERKKEIQEGARTLKEELMLSDEKASEYKTLAEIVGKSLDEFQKTNEFLNEKRRWESATKLNDIIMNNQELLKEITDRKSELRDFLIGNIDDFDIIDEITKKLLYQFRDSIHMQKSVLHKSDSEFEQEINVLLEKI